MGRPRKTPSLLDQSLAGGNRRLFDRKPWTCSVIFEDELGDPLLQLESSNISVGGLFLQGDVPIRAGARAFLSFRLPSAPGPIRLVGEVVRTESGGRGAGIGVRFVEVPPEVRVLLEDWLKTAKEGS